MRITDVGVPVPASPHVDPPDDDRPASRGGVAVLAALFGLGAIAIWIAAYQDSAQRAEAVPSSSSATTASVAPTTTTSSAPSTTTTVPAPPATTIVGDGWDAAVFRAGFWLQDVVELDGEWVAVGFDDGRPAILGSPDGLRWSAISTDLPDGFFVALDRDGEGVRVGVVRGNDGEIVDHWRSDDARDWELVRSTDPGLTNIRDADFSGEALLVVGVAADPALDPIDGARAYLAEQADLIIDEEICGIEAGFLTLPENEGKAGFTIRSCGDEVLGEIDRNAGMAPDLQRCLTDVAVATARREAVAIVSAGGEVRVHFLPLFGAAGPTAVVGDGFVVSSLGGRAAYEVVMGPCFGAGEPAVNLHRPGQDAVELNPGPLPDHPGSPRLSGWIAQSVVNGDLIVRDAGSAAVQPLFRRSSPPYDTWVDVDAGGEAGFPSPDGSLLVRQGPAQTSEIARVVDPEGLRWTSIPLGFPIFASADDAYVLMPIDGRDHLVRIPLP